MPFELDPRFTFDSFVVGPANRLAVAAARRVADQPSSTYNPLFIYSASGLGKTHLLTAIGHHVHRLHAGPVVFETLKSLMNAISDAVKAGDRDAYHARLQETGVLLLDDVQFLAGQRQVQEELIRTWDALSGASTQVVLTSDRPPQEIDGLDDRVLSRLSGGLIVDMAAPDSETRVAIARRKAEERGRPLSAEVCRAVGRIPFTNVRELQGALNRLIAVQELESRTVRADEVVELLGAAAERGEDEFGELLDITGTVRSDVGDGGEEGSGRGGGAAASGAPSASSDMGDVGEEGSGRGGGAAASETPSTGVDTGDGGERGARGEPAASGSPTSADSHEPVEEGGETEAVSGSTGSTGKEKVLWEWPYPGDWIEESLD